MIDLNRVSSIVHENEDVERLLINNEIVWEKASENYDWYISMTGSNSNNGKSLSTAFKDLSVLPSVLEAGDRVYVDSGTYSTPANTEITVPFELIGNENQRPIFTHATTGGRILILNLSANDFSEYTSKIKNIEFTNSVTSGNRGLVDYNMGTTNHLEVDNCKFTKAYWQWNGRALQGSMNGANASLLVTNSEFYDNNAYGYGHTAASVIAWGSAGRLRVYNCIFNNPRGDQQYYCSNNGRAISAQNGYNSCSIDARGSCNQFLGAGDSCFKGYVEESCE